MKRINSSERRQLRQDLCAAYGGHCAYCNRAIGMKGTVDHYLPQAAGGSNEWGNLRWACVVCNGLKADMSPEEWEVRRRLLFVMPPSKWEVRVRLLQLCAARQRLSSTIESHPHGSSRQDQDSTEGA